MSRSSGRIRFSQNKILACGQTDKHTYAKVSIIKAFNNNKNNCSVYFFPNKKQAIFRHKYLFMFFYKILHEIDTNITGIYNIVYIRVHSYIFQFYFVKHR